MSCINLRTTLSQIAQLRTDVDTFCASLTDPSLSVEDLFTRIEEYNKIYSNQEKEIQKVFADQREYYKLGAALRKKLGFDKVGKFHEGFAIAEYRRKNFFITTTGERLNNEEYDDVGDFSDGLACVQQNGKWHFITTTGERLNGEEYDVAGNFSNGLACVCQNET